MSKELEEEENILKQCIEKLKVVEANRLTLVSQLKEALNEQVSDKCIWFSLSVLDKFSCCTYRPTHCFLILSGI